MEYKQHLKFNKPAKQKKALREGTSILEYIAKERESNRKFIAKQKKEERIREVKKESFKLLLSLPVFAFYIATVYWLLEVVFKINISFFQTIVFSFTILWLSWFAFLFLRGIWPKIFID